MLRYSILFVLLGCSGYANLIRNPSFETVPGPASGQGILPSDWIQLGSFLPVADTYSNDGSYGLFPSASGNFPGTTAWEGIRWVAGGSGGIAIAPVPEVFGQLLSSPLVPGQTYLMVAFLIAAQRADISGAGAYRISIAADAASVGSAVLLGEFSPAADRWQQRFFTFTAPSNADLLPLLVFTPYAAGTTTAYPGVDEVALYAWPADVPEPGTMLLALTAASVLGASHLRSRRRKIG